MHYSRLALRGIAVAVIVAISLAFFAACSSEDEQSQPAQTRQAQQEPESRQAQPAPSAQSAGDSQDQQDQRNQPAQQQEQQQAGSDQRVAQTQQGDQTDQSDQMAQDAQPSTDQQQESQAEAVESQQQEQSQAEPPAQQTEQTEQDEAAAGQSAADSDAQAEEMQPESAEQEQAQDPAEMERLRLRAEEISAQATVNDLVGINAWLNGEETSIALELAKGNIVLIDFWTYTCINCVRTLPFLTAWDEKYREHGLVIISVHTPEFQFEERLENVSMAIAEHDIEYLVAVDNDYRTWRVLQGSRGFWPRKFLIGPTPDGSPMGVRYDHIGEGDYEETEHQIRAALEAIGKDLSGVPFGVNVAVPDRSDVARGAQTRELYGGWRRNTGGGGPYAGQEEYFLAGLSIEHLYRDVDSGDREHNRWYLEGLWRAESEAIAHARDTENLEDYMALIVRARTANVVLTVAEDGQPYDVFIQYNDDWVQPEFAGEHIQWDGDGRSYIRVNQNDLYRLLFFEDFTEGELKLSSNSDQFRIFAFTFGSYVGGE